MKTFTMKRLNLKHQAKFPLRPEVRVVQTIHLSRELSILQLMIRLILQASIASLLILVPVAEAHAKAKAKTRKPAKVTKVAKTTKQQNRKVVSIVFDTTTPSSETDRPQKDSKIGRTLKPVDRYADDDTIANVDADIDSDLEAAPVPKSIAAVIPRAKKPVSANAGIEDSLAEEKNETLVQFPMVQRPLDKKEILMNTDIDLAEEYY